MFLVFAVQVFALIHALHGWSPMLMLLRHVGFRTQGEIEWEPLRPQRPADDGACRRARSPSDALAIPAAPAPGIAPAPEIAPAPALGSAAATRRRSPGQLHPTARLHAGTPPSAGADTASTACYGVPNYRKIQRHRQPPPAAGQAVENLGSVDSRSDSVGVTGAMLTYS